MPLYLLIYKAHLYDTLFALMLTMSAAAVPVSVLVMVTGSRVRGKVACVADADLVTSLREAGVNRGDLVALVVTPALGYGLAAAGRTWTVPGPRGRGGAGPRGTATAVGDVVGPRRRRGWPPTGCAWPRAGTSRPRTGCCSAGRRADPGWAWARVRGLDTEAIPALGTARPVRHGRR